MPQGWLHIVIERMLPWLVVGGGVATLAVVLFLIRFVMRRDGPQRGGVRLTLAEQRALERDMGRLVSELAQMARDVGAQLDSQALRLAELIQQADERLVQLQQALPESPRKEIKEIVVGEILKEPSAPSAESDGRHVEIYTLADQGIALAEIARRVHKPSGEIELILALRPSGARSIHQ